MNIDDSRCDREKHEAIHVFQLGLLNNFVRQLGLEPRTTEV
jgi:hypothetical protein